MEKRYNYSDLLKIIEKLRSKDGCPWDRVQTHESLKTCLVEECYEVIEAIDRKDDDNLAEELGDVLLQVVLHSQIAKEEDRFSIDDVVQALSEKMIRRHPHVFGSSEADTPEEGLRNWEEIKQREKKDKLLERRGELGNVPKAFPALVRAQKVQKKAEKNYEYSSGVQEECNIIRELLSQIEQNDNHTKNESDTDDIEELLFRVSNLARILGRNAENSLTNATETFINKFEG